LLTIGGCASNPLVRASVGTDPRVLKTALDGGADPNATDYKRRSVLELAVLKKRTENVRLLAAAGANVNHVGPYGRSPLHWTAIRGYPEIAKILIRHEANLDIKDARFEATPLIEAVWANQTKMVRLLLAAGANPNIVERRRSGGTALHIAIRQGRAGMVELLMKSDADPTRRDRRGQSARELAKRLKRKNIIALVNRTAPSGKSYAAVALESAARVKPAPPKSIPRRQLARTQPPPRREVPAPVVQELRGPGPVIYQPGYNRRVAAVIGINDYELWPELEGARDDARRFAQTLRDLGFDHVEEIYDREASRERILRLLGTELVQQTDRDDLAVIFFAGHGHTETLQNGEKRGYIVPADGDPADVFATGISMSTLRELSNRLPAKHVYYAMDSCYSGLGFARGIRIPKTTEGYLQMVQTRRAVQMVTAGGEGEQAYERGGRGLFTTYLVRALNGEADFDGDGAVTASELGTFIRPQVSTASGQRQTPQFGTLDGMGEIVFQRR
jgi:hypothetical protein